MYASVTTGLAQSGKLGECLQLWRDSIAPEVRQIKGFKGRYVLTDQATGKTLTVVLYETQEDAQAVQTSGRYQEVVAMLGNTLVRESLVRTGYEVSIQV